MVEVSTESPNNGSSTSLEIEGFWKADALLTQRSKVLCDCHGVRT
jgi:hypothetical protein